MTHRGLTRTRSTHNETPVSTECRGVWGVFPVVPDRMDTVHFRPGVPRGVGPDLRRWNDVGLRRRGTRVKVDEEVRVGSSRVSRGLLRSVGRDGA